MRMQCACLVIMSLLFVDSQILPGWVRVSSFFKYTPHGEKEIVHLSAEHASCGERRCVCDTVLADCSYTEFRNHFSSVPWLGSRIAYLDLSRNNLRAINRVDFFHNVTGVTAIDLSGNLISDVTAGAFRPLQNLTILFLTGNLLSTQKALAPVLSVARLEYLDLTSNDIHSLPDGLFKMYPLRHLKDLILDRNPMCLLNMTNLMPLESLTHFYLSHPQVTKIISDHLPNLEALSVKYDSFITSCQHGSSLYPNLRVLYLAPLYLGSSIFDSETCLPHLEMLVFLTTAFMIEQGTFSKGQFESLEALSITASFSFGICELRKYAFANANVTEIELSNSRLNFAKDTVDEDSFAGCSNLLSLNLQGNDFSRVSRERFLRLFGRLTSLEALNLQSTSLSRVSPEMFANFRHLTILLLGDNKLASIADGTFNNLNSLAMLDLSNNMISFIQDTVFRASTRKRLTTLDLSGNPFECTCELKWLQKWIESKPSLFSMRAVTYLFNDTWVEVSPLSLLILDIPEPNYDCRNKANTTVRSFLIPDQACLLSHEASLSITTIFTTLILLSTMCLALFRYRWHIRLLLYEAFRGRGDRLQRLREHSFKYDVFVSFDSDDLHWVQEHLMPMLEQAAGLRLCIHERDFIPGKNIVDNIADCVEASKKVMVLFSPNFAQSPWCQFELNFCLSHMMECGDEMIVVFLRHVPARIMTPAMSAIIKTMTYIEWADEPDARESFWRRLQLALREILPSV